MRLAIITDIHASQSNIEETKYGMNEVNKICDDKDIQWLIIAGDIFHDFNIGGKYESFGSVFDSINGPINDFLASDEKRRILMIPGNHDMPTEKGSKDALTSWEYNPKIYISRDIELFKLDAGLHVITLPWMWSHQYKQKSHLLKRMQELKYHVESGKTMLIGHCEIEGTPFPSGYTMFGGNFSFTKEDIDKLKFNIVALGHIHKQDTWYIGTPWQHNFGECELQGTMRYIDTNGFQNQLENHIVPIPNTAKYHIIDIKNLSNFKVPKGDHVKVIGDKLTTALPKGWKFEKKKENYKAVTRSVSDYGDSISTWLQKWVSEKKIKVSIADCLDIIKDVNIKGRYIHNRSLNSFDFIHIKGVGPHKDTKISFGDPIIAISGENGCLSGNTMIDCPRDLTKYPKGILIKDLVGKKPYVYAWKNGTITIKQASKVFLTKKQAKVIKVKLTGRSKSDKKYSSTGMRKNPIYSPPWEIIGTPEHKVLLSDGITWKQLKDLENGDSICSMYRRVHNHKDVSKSSDSIIHWTHGPKRVREHRFIASEIYGYMPKNIHAHHKDKNPLNQSVGNIEWKDSSIHLSEHTTERNLKCESGWQKYGNHPKGMKGKKHSEETKLRIRKAGKEVWKKRKEKLLNHTVISIEDYGYEDVYDMTVPDTGNFIANGIVVHNSGKTIFMESLFASLYGHLPSYGKVNHISDKIASIEAEFSTDKDSYRVLRTFNGDDKKAHVWKNGETTAFIGPKISEVKKFMEKVIGPEELLLSSVFSTQHYAGDIVDLDPGNRKDIFNKLLGLENLAEVKEVVDEKLKALVKKKETLTSQYGAMSTVEQLETTIVHNMKQLTENRAKINRGNIQKNALTNKNDLLNSEILLFSKELTIKNNYEKGMVTYTKKMSDIKMCIDSKQDEIIKRENFGDSKVLESKLQGCEKVLANFNALFLKQKKDYEKQAKLTKICADKQEEYNKAFQNTEAIIDKYNINKKKIKEDKEILKDVGCKDKILPCKFVDNSMESIKTEANLDKSYNKTIKEKRIKLKQLKDEVDICNKRKKKFKVTEVNEVDFENTKIEIQQLRKKIEDINNNQNFINIAKTELKSLKDQLDEAQKSHTNLHKKVALLSKITQEKFDLLNYKNKLQCKEIEDLEKEINSWTVKSTEHRKELEFSRNEIVKMQKYDKEISGLTTEIEKYEIVSKAFSKDGIPQLMIDCALPQLQDILNQLTSYIQKFDIKISTQQEQKNETLKETISFIVDDGIKQRDIKYFSGGEKKLLKSIVRLSLSLFQSQRSCSSYKLLCLDEAFDALDRDNSILLLRIIYNLKSKFNQIFIISHSIDILGNLSKCIKFKKEGDKTIIV